MAADEDDVPTVASLPHVLLLLIFALLPVDLRARCACVCRGWRAALAERSLWTRLDVSRTSGVTSVVTDALLRGAAARAGGALETLDMSGSRAVSRVALLEVATASVTTLHELHASHAERTAEALDGVLLLSLDDAEALLRAAPALRSLDADVECDSVAAARRALRADDDGGLLAPLRVRALRVNLRGASDADALALAADVAAHAWLADLRLGGTPAPPVAVLVLDALLHTAQSRRLTSLRCDFCGLSPASAPALACLLRDGALTSLCVLDIQVLLDMPSASLLAAALRANATLTSLQLSGVRLWRDADAAAELLGALTAHASLRVLNLLCNAAAADANRAAAGVSLAALLAANAPALTHLDVSDCWLLDDGLRPLCAALRANTHLRSLSLHNNDMSDAFAADVLLPAVRANSSLRALTTGAQHPGAREATDVVSSRTQGVR
jgi:hypothetical protein